LSTGFLELPSRPRGRGNLRRYAVRAEAPLDVLSEWHLVPRRSQRGARPELEPPRWPGEACVADPALVEIVDRYELEADPSGYLVLRGVPESWPLPPQLRVVPELVAAADLARGPELVDLGRAGGRAHADLRRSRRRRRFGR
jgi:hypothetical protein